MLRCHFRSLADAAGTRSPPPWKQARMNGFKTQRHHLGESTASRLRPAGDSRCRSLPATVGESPDLSRVSAEQTAPQTGLSVRAENVLKELAAELTGETPPQGRWSPCDLLIERLTYKHLSIARNCGPQTTAEIITWARKRGKVIKPSAQAKKSLSDMWHDIVEKFSAGEISKAEVAEALEKSTRRKNTKIPVAFQRMLLQLVRSSSE